MHLISDFKNIVSPYTFSTSLVYRNAKQQIKGGNIMISGKTLDL